MAEFARRGICSIWFTYHDNRQMIYYIFVILGIFACSLSQLLLKKSAIKNHQSRITEIVNPWVIAAYAIFFSSLLVNIWAMSKGLQLKEMAMLESLGYIFVPLLSVILLKEQMSKRTILGVGIIIVGIFVFYL